MVKLARVAAALTCAMSAVPLHAAAAAPDVRRYAIIIAYNRSVDAGVAPLSFADDDGAKFYELFTALGAGVTFLAVLDGDAQPRFPEATAASRPPTKQAFLDSVRATFARIEKDKAAGAETHFYFVYSGHGHVAANHEGFLNLVDGTLPRSELYRDVIAKSPATWNHLILDACNAYFVVQKRGSGRTDKVAGQAAALKRFLESEELTRYPNTGVILAASSESETHEWSRWQAGLFSHELRSALLGAADVNGDGAVTYGEAAASVEAANANVKDPAARLRVYVRPPPARIDLPLLATREIKGSSALRFDAALGHVYIEDSRGVRIADMNPGRDASPVVALVGKPPFYLRGAEEEAEVPLTRRGRDAVAASSLRFGPLASRHKGSVEETFRRDLFTQPFGESFYRGITISQGPDSSQWDGWFAARERPEADGSERMAEVSSPAGATGAMGPGRGAGTRTAAADNGTARVRVRVAIVPLQAKRLPADTVQVLDDLLTYSATRLDRFEVISPTEIATLIGYERMKDMAGCDDATCLVQIGGALGVDYLLGGSVGQIGSQVVVSLQLTDITEVKVVRRAQARCDAVEDRYPGAVEEALADVVSVLATTPPGADNTAVAKDTKSPARVDATVRSGTTARPQVAPTTAAGSETADTASPGDATPRESAARREDSDGAGAGDAESHRFEATSPTSPTPQAPATQVATVATVRSPPPTPMSSLRVQTTPPGATIFLDDRELGVAPLEQPLPSTGEHRVRVALQGYSSAEQELWLLPGRLTSLEVALLTSRDYDERRSQRTSKLAFGLASLGASLALGGGATYAFLNRGDGDEIKARYDAYLDDPNLDEDSRAYKEIQADLKHYNVYTGAAAGMGGVAVIAFGFALYELLSIPSLGETHVSIGMMPTKQGAGAVLQGSL